MLKSLLTFATLLSGVLSFSQIQGTVTSSKNQPLPVVNIFIENTYIGTTSNDDGKYELNINKPGDYTVVFQYLGYKTLKKNVTINKFPFVIDAQLNEEQISLNEVVINAEENPANQIIRNVIETKKELQDKINSFKANFYSRGLIRIENAPEKILGQDVGDLGGGLDSTRSGVIYLSETISKIEYQKPDKLKERVLASKISGDDNGFSFNSASDIDFNFYDNTVELGNLIISPLANNAFNYYRYKLEGVFYDDKGNLINKIKATPKRENDRVFSGYVYIVEDQWAIYAVELDITGKQAQMPAADIIKIKQNFSYSDTNKIWALISQSFDFKYGIFGITGSGRFNAVYSDYEFNPQFGKKNFTREVLSFESEANKKDSLFWTKKRPIPLTSEEITDYIKKDSIQLVKKSKPYLDSIDRDNNTFKLGALIGGYSYQNSHKNTRFSISSPISKISFNTVQGWNSNMGISYTKNYNEFKRYLRTNVNVDYGVSEEKLRATGAITYKFNNISKPFLTLSGGVKTEQFNNSNPISRLINTISSLFFEDNYVKLYEKSFAQLNYSEELFNGLRFSSSIAYEKRKPLFNTSNYVTFPEDNDIYTSNNPLNEEAFGIAPFVSHNIIKFSTYARIRFAQNYTTYPDSKFNFFSSKYPTLTLGYEKGFSASDKNLNFDQFKIRLSQNFNVGNKGNFSYNLKTGTFLNANTIAFMDYQHFNGNQTHVGSGTYTNVFNNLPYYNLSTNASYFEGHIEHDFKGYILGKVPLLNKLNYNLVIGTHGLNTKNNTPYNEFSIGINNLGWGKFRFLRVDYLRSYQSGFINDAVVFGLKF